MAWEGWVDIIHQWAEGRRDWLDRLARGILFIRKDAARAIDCIDRYVDIYTCICLDLQIDSILE